VIIIRIIDNLNQLDKPLMEYKIIENSDLSNYEKEITATFSNDGVLFHSDKRTGIKWAVEMLECDYADLIRIYLRNDNIIHIDIKTEFNFVTFKSKPRGSDGVSDMFSMPLAYKSNDFFQKTS